MSDLIAPLTNADASSNSLTMTTKPLALLPFIGENLDAWQIHRCQVSAGSISQHAPMKMIYHYEHLDDDTKQNFPLTGLLLARFDHLMTRELFAEQLGVASKQVAKPWQLKFSGKLVVFHANPEIALRLQWTNTLKDFEPVYHEDLTTAIEQSFLHWQLVGGIEVVNKNPHIYLMAEQSDGAHWQLSASPQFEPLPAELSLMIQQFLYTQATVQQTWLAAIIERAKDYAKAYRMANEA